MHELAKQDLELPELSGMDVHETMAQFPNDHHIFSTDQLDRVYELEDMGLSYEDIAAVLECDDDYPESISRETIRRYCKNTDVEPAYAE